MGFETFSIRQPFVHQSSPGGILDYIRSIATRLKFGDGTRTNKSCITCLVRDSFWDYDEIFARLSTFWKSKSIDFMTSQSDMDTEDWLDR